MPILDVTLPDDDSKIFEIPAYIRESRQAIIDSGSINVISVDLASDPVPAIPATGLTVMTLYSYLGAELSAIDGGSAGDILTILFATDDITVIHGVGNLSLRGDPSNPDFPAEENDSLALLFRDSVWHEVNRSLK